MGKIVFPATDILSVSDLIRQIAQSNANGDRFCFILGAGASVESKIPTGFDLELAWMRYLMGKEADKYEKPLPKSSYSSQAIAFLQKREPEETRGLAERMQADKKLSHSFEAILRAWKDAEKWVKAKEAKTSYPCKYNFSEYYFDIYRLRFYPEKKNGYRYLERIMEACSPSIGYHTLALLLTRTNQNNLVITTNFDSLVEDALFLYTDKKPLVVSHESLADFIDPNLQRPIIAKVHRGLFYDPMNSPDTRLSEEWKKILDNLLAVYTPIVIGYSGSDNSLMKYLEKNEKLQQIYWCFRGSETDVPDRVKKLVLKKGGNLVAIPGFDAMMLDIGTRLYLTEMAPKSTEKNQNEQLQARMTEYREKWEDWKTKNAAPEMQEQIRRMEQAERYSEFEAKAYSAYKNGDLETAIRFCTEAIRCGNDSSVDYFNRALCHQELHQSQEAIADYSRAIELKPDDAEAYCNRGNVYNDLGQTDAALADYRKAIELKPDDAEVYYNGGIVHRKLGQKNEALQYYSKAIELKPDDAEAYNNRGNVYYDLGQKDAALADFRKAIELKPDDAKAYNNRGAVYQALGQMDAALADYSKAIELKPDNAEAYNNRGYFYAKQGEYEQALADLQKSLQIAPEEASTFHSLGFTYMHRGREGDNALALEAFTKAIQLDGEDPQFYQDRATVYRRMGEEALAQADETKAEELRSSKA